MWSVSSCILIRRPQTRPCKSQSATAKRPCKTPPATANDRVRHRQRQQKTVYDSLRQRIDRPASHRLRPQKDHVQIRLRPQKETLSESVCEHKKTLSKSVYEHKKTLSESVYRIGLRPQKDPVRIRLRYQKAQKDPVRIRLRPQKRPRQNQSTNTKGQSTAILLLL